MQAKKDYYSSNPRKQGVIMEQVNVKNDSTTLIGLGG